jgi:hypothetical protein
MRTHTHAISHAHAHTHTLSHAHAGYDATLDDHQQQQDAGREGREELNASPMGEDQGNELADGKYHMYQLTVVGTGCA